MQRLEWRLANNAEVDCLVGEWTARHDVATIVAQLGVADIACSPVRTPEQAIAWPHLRERGMVQPLLRPGGEATGVVAAGFPFKFGRTQATLEKLAPVPGAHTAEVFARFLGLGAAELEALARRSVV